MGRLNLSLHRGETLDRTCTWWTVLNVTPRNLTGYSLRLQIRDNPGGSTLYADLQIGSGITLVDAAAGKFRFVASAAATAAWLFASARYDLKATDPGGVVSYPLEGAVSVEAPVTP